MTIVVYLPMSLMKKLTALGYISILSVVAVIYTTFVLVGETPEYLKQQEDFLENIHFLNFK